MLEEAKTQYGSWAWPLHVNKFKQVLIVFFPQGECTNMSSKPQLHYWITAFIVYCPFDAKQATQI